MAVALRLRAALSLLFVAVPGLTADGVVRPLATLLPGIRDAQLRRLLLQTLPA